MQKDKGKIYFREDLEYRCSHLTIERQLKMYEQHPEGDERATTLWITWQQNKRCLSHLLDFTLASFPTYSRHDSSHSETVLHNIERILGENRIESLSATDCFAILHTVYLHDIGMAIFADDRKAIFKSDDFLEMIEDLATGSDKDLKNAALLLKKRYYVLKSDGEYKNDGMAYINSEKALYTQKLDTYYAVVLLMSEYQRRCHGSKVTSTVRNWITSHDNLHSGFTMSEIPLRIFLKIAACASLHTDWEFSHILELPWEEDGYTDDMLHPRFVAVLLQLGDALDIDNDRFHPFSYAFAGSFPTQSEAHYSKHLSIRTLKITPEEILIEADCETREAIQLIKSECAGIENLLKSSSYHWSSIAPKGFNGALPSFKLFKLRLNGKEIPWDLAASHFQISQDKALSYLPSENSKHFPFVRELLQNAIDASKLQYYEDYRQSTKFRFNDGVSNQNTPKIADISKIINPVEYPVEITLSCVRVIDNNTYEELSLSDIPSDVSLNAENYGILFSIKDYGTGISIKDLRDVIKVGTSYENRKKMLREIPEWLRPTGMFGIGIQYLFSVCKNFSCVTFVRNGECHKISFFSSVNGKERFISLEPVETDNSPMAYGTRFDIFISHEKRKIYSDDTNTGSPYDPFSETYEPHQIKHNIVMLTRQILMDINNLVEELLFPVYVLVRYDLGEMQRELLKSNLPKIVFSNLKREYFTEKDLKRHVCWIYQNTDEETNNSNVSRFAIEKGVCQVNLSQMKIYLWLDELSVSACFGVDFVANDGLQISQSQCNFYYKGIWVDTRNVSKNGNLLEYVNIQGNQRGRKLIQFSRNGFTQEGLSYIESTLIPQIYSSLFDGLKKLATQNFFSEKDLKKISFSEKIKENIEKYMKEDLNSKSNIHEKIWQKQLVGISLYYNFYIRECANRKTIYLSSREEYERNQWEEAIRKVSEAVCGRRNNTMDIHSSLSVTEIYADLQKNDFTALGKKEITIADFYRKENKFAVVSKRRDTGDKWINRLIWLKPPENITEKKIPALIELLEIPLSERIKTLDWAETLESWSDFMLENMIGALESQSIQQSNFVLTLLQSVSISACFMDVSGNLKIHILSGQPSGSVYYNTHAKYKLLKRMEKRKYTTNAERFAGNTWMGYELLQIPEIFEDICNIKEQYIQGNETYMIFPCSGNAVCQLIQYAEMPEEKYWFDIRQEDNTQREMADYLTTTKEKLRKIAEGLYSCIAIDYTHVKETCEELFIASYVGYCKRERVRTTEISYWDFLSNGYSLRLGTAFREELDEKEDKGTRDSWKDYSVNSLTTEKLKQSVQERLPKEETFDTLKGIIELGILNNSEAILGGKELSGIEGSDLLEYMDQLKEYCFNWQWLWNLVEHLQIKLKTQEIKGFLLERSAGNENLISWISRQTHTEQYSVAECYNRMWDELINTVLRRRECNTEEQHFKLLDWMRKKEENMEKNENGTICGSGN